MNRLGSELRRLYLPPQTQADAADATRLPLVGADGRTRAAALEVEGAGGWDSLAAVWQGVQVDFQLPAPGIAVTGRGLQLWFSLAEPIAAGEASAFLSALKTRYLADVPQDRIHTAPRDGAAQRSASLPPFEVAPDRWSAFVAPDLATLFADEPWLDLPPGADAQAELLSRLQSTRPADVARVSASSQVAAASAGDAATSAPAAIAAIAPSTQLTDPRQFLLQVMNDGSVDLRLRIEAAKALLPYSPP